LEQFARDLIGQYGSKLQIKEKKSSVVTYQQVGDRQKVAVIKGEKCRNGLEYLGFRYDGNRIFIRDSTIQGLYRKVTAAARREAMALARRYPNKSADELRAYCNFEEFVSRFGRVEDFDELEDNYRKWTFWTYAQRAASVMGTLGAPIRRQLRKQREIILHKLNAEFDRAVERRKR
jgi:hypothetical protein